MVICICADCTPAPSNLFTAHPQLGSVIRVQTAIQAPRQTDEGDLLQGDPEGSGETINHLPVEENTKSSATESITPEKYLDKTNT